MPETHDAPRVVQGKQPRQQQPAEPVPEKREVGQAEQEEQGGKEHQGSKSRSLGCRRSPNGKHLTGVTRAEEVPWRGVAARSGRGPRRRETCLNLRGAS